MSQPPTDLLARAWEYYQTGDLVQAEACCRDVVQRQPQRAEAWRLRGLIAQQARRFDAALAHHAQAARLRPDWAEAHNDHGIALAQAGRVAEAVAAFEQCLRSRPDHTNACLNLGNALSLLGKPAEAEQAFSRCIRLEPTEADGHFRLGTLLRQQGRLLEATISLRHACRFEAGHAAAHKALGGVLFDLGQPAEAVEVWRKTLTLTPRDADTLNDLGNALRQLERGDEALASYQQALAVNPDLGPAHANLGNIFAEQGHTEKARNHYQQAYRCQPSGRLRLLYETMLPIIYESMDQVREARARFTDAVRRLNDDGVRIDPTRELVPTHFYLAYQGHNDRDLHAGVARVGAGPRSLDVRLAPRTGGDRIRIGFLSRYLRNHTIGQLNLGLIAGLDRRRFEVLVLAVGPPPDEGLGQRIAQAADRYLPLPPHLPASIQAVAGLGLDVLYLPDIGMDTQTYSMAFSRLAPVQVVSWGHPVTTGLPTVDYFVTTPDLDPPGNEAHYTEKLLRLPRLNVVYERPTLTGPPRDRSHFGLPADAHLYTCPQTLFKFHPELDAILADILRQDPAGLLVLVEGRELYWKDVILQRLARSIPDAASRVRFVPKLLREDFLHLLAVSDVLLDPIHFGGGNTSYEGLALGTPIVTLPSALLRGRLTYAMYRQMELPDLIAADAADYVRLAVRLGTDADFRAATRQRIQERSPVLFDDRAIVGELERALTAAVAAAAGPAARR